MRFGSSGEGEEARVRARGKSSIGNIVVGTRCCCSRRRLPSRYGVFSAISHFSLLLQIPRSPPRRCGGGGGGGGAGYKFLKRLHVSLQMRATCGPAGNAAPTPGNDNSTEPGNNKRLFMTLLFVLNGPSPPPLPVTVELYRHKIQRRGGLNLGTVLGCIEIPQSISPTITSFCEN